MKEVKPMRACRDCRDVKPVAEFYTDRPYCKPCDNARRARHMRTQVTANRDIAAMRKRLGR